MEHILEPNSSFDFSQISCISPSSISGGNYFIRTLTKKQEPLYIQSPKCFTKQGIVKSGKKMYCDLLLKHEDESFLEFLESLESFCHKQIFDNRERWFDSGLTIVDIENCFVCPTKSFKSGKMHLLRTNVPVRLGKCDIRIFDEQEQDVPLENVKETTNVITILEIQGIRCLARNFQIDLEIKQMMILKPKDIFERCLFGKTVKEDQPAPLKPEPMSLEPESIPESKEQESKEQESGEEAAKEPELKEPESKEEAEEAEEAELAESEESEYEEPVKETKENIENGLCEVNLELSETEINQCEIKLKKPKEVYYEIYKKAKKKAQIARDIAIASYLSAKQIKHNYLKGEDMSDDDDDDEMRTQEKELREL